MSVLPDLPKKRRKREQDVTPKVLAWFREHFKESCAIEVKVTDTDSIPESALLPHQKLALYDAAHGSLVHKIADSARRNPFDAFMLVKVPAYVVACFPHKGVCAIIPADDWRGLHSRDLYRCTQFKL